jgi:hypothetical protein
MLLCDYAEELGGKLYIMGGGWSRLGTPNQPSNLALAIKLSVPWNQANEPHNLTVRLVNGNGEQQQDPQGNDVQIMGKLEVGRPPGLRPGSTLDVPIAAQFNGLVLEPGIYRWELEVDGVPMGDTTFDVVQLG